MTTSRDSTEAGGLHGFADEQSPPPLRIGIHKGLLVDSPYTLERPHVEGVLGAQVARVDRLDLTGGLVIMLFLLQSGHLRFSEDDPFLGHLFLQGAQAIFETGQLVTQPPDAANTTG